MANIYMLIFDANMETKEDQKNYRMFLSLIKNKGYQYIQNSTYVRINYAVKHSLQHETTDVSKLTPSTIKVLILELTRLAYENISKINNAFLPDIHEREVLIF